MKKIFFLLLYVSHAQGRLMHSLSYNQLLQKSDLVVIATPVGSAKDTKEIVELPDVRLRAIGIETGFLVSVVLKGELQIRSFVLHHYRLADPEPAQINGPLLTTFATKDSQAQKSDLLFLVKEKDGRYAPTGGQTDPFFNSIVELPLDSK